MNMSCFVSKVLYFLSGSEAKSYGIKEQSGTGIILLNFNVPISFFPEAEFSVIRIIGTIEGLIAVLPSINK